MLAGSKHFVALHLRWSLFFLIASAAAIGWYLSYARGATRWPGGGSLPGFVFGLLAALIIVFECALWLRKTVWFRTRRWLGPAQLWMKAHLWLGLLTVPLVLLHSGFRFGSSLTFVLAWIFIGVISSGVLGLVAQNVLPRFLLDHLSEETIGSQLETVARQYLSDAERIVALTCGESSSDVTGEPRTNTGGIAVETLREIGARRRLGTQIERSPSGNVSYPQVHQASELRREFAAEIRPYLESGRSPTGKVGTPRRDDAYFLALRKAVHPDAHTAVSAIQDLCRRRNQLNVQNRVQILLHGWLLIHLPLSLGLLILMLVHAYFALRFA